MKLILFTLAALSFAPLLATAQTTKNVDIVVTHGTSCAGGPTISVNNPTPMAGAPVAVTVACGPGNPGDFVQLVIDHNRNALGPQFYLNGATGGTFTLTSPNVISDRPTYYAAAFYANGSYYQELAETPITMAPTITPANPTQFLPSALAADPFVPAHTVTVCASGCDYTALGDATNATFNAGWDNVKIVISAGDYQFPAHTLGASYPKHTWIKGISADGHTFPHIFGRETNTGQDLFFMHTWFDPTLATMTIDNVELGPWDSDAIGTIERQILTLRNVYIHDTSQGMLTGNTNHLTLNIYNSVFARNGGTSGPRHNVYVGEGDNTNVVTVKNSVFEQAFYGHSFKERALSFNSSCSIFAVNQDLTFTGSETIDIDSGVVALNNILSVNGGGSSAGWTNQNSWDNIRYGVDQEANLPATNTITATGSTFLADQPGSGHWHVTTAIRFSTTPMTWKNDRFIWHDAGSRQPGPGGNNQADATGALYSMHSGDTVDITLDGSNSFSTNGWAGSGNYPKGWRDFLPLMPAACTDPIGLVKIPAS
jgi:hypothetical protein